jgi:4-hydroxybenzoate polyprenyltransferase
MIYLRLLRFPNLILVALTQSLLYDRIIRKALLDGNIEPVLDGAQFALFVFITAGITACGYLTNDLIDLKIDQVNRPEKVILGRRVSIRQA